MTPKWEVIHGDCLDVMRGMATGSVDAVICDPPYGVSERTDRKSKGRSNLAECYDFPPVYGDDKPFDPSPWLAFPRVVLWGANHYGSRLPDASCWLVWDKRDGIASNDNADCEIAWTNLPGPARLYHHMWSGMIKASERDARRVHPTQKPVSLGAWCLRMAKVEPGMTVLDPYMGSGSFGVACVEAGVNYIGIEREAEYVAIARARIEAAARAPMLDFTSPPSGGGS